MPGGLYLDNDQASDLRANTAIAQAKDDWYQTTAPDRAVDAVRSDYYSTRAADDAIAQTRTDYYSQRSLQFGDTLGAPSQTQAAGVSDTAPPIPAVQQASPSSQTPAAPVASGLSPTAPVTASLSQTAPGGQFSPYDAVFAKYAGPFANDPEFIKIVAAGTKAESNWDASSTTGDGGHSWGLFQMHDKGAGAGMGNARLDPDQASAVMVPKYAAAYSQLKDKLSGPALAAAVAQSAERSADPTGSAYAKAYSQLGSGQTNPVGDFFSGLGTAAQGAVQAAQGALQNAGATGSPLDALASVAQPGLQSPLQTMADLSNKYTDSSDPLNLKVRDRMSPEDQQQWDNLILAVGGVTMGGGGQAAKSGTDLLNAALEDIKTYPQQVQQTAAELVQRARSIGMADSDIAAQVRRFIQQNPAPETAGVASAAERTAQAVPAAETEGAAATPIAPEAAAAETPAPAAVGAIAPSPAPGIGSALAAIPAELKKSIFSLSNVHAANIARGLITSPAGPQGAAQFVGRYTTALIRGASNPADEAEFADLAKQAADDGLNLFGGQNPETGGAAVGVNPLLVKAAQVVGGAVTGAGGAYETSQRAGASDEDTLRNVIAGGAIGAIAGPTLTPRINAALWQDAVPFAKLMVYKAATDGGVAGDQAAIFANNLNGGQNLAAVAGSKPMQDLIRFFVQSPDWAASQLKLTGAGLTGTAKTLTGQALTGNEQLSRDWLLKTILTYGLTTEATQFALTGHFTDQNTPGHQFMVEWPSGTPNAKGNPQNLTMSFFDSNVQQILDAASRIKGNPVGGTETTIWDKLNRIPTTLAAEAFNAQYPGGPEITKPTTKVFGKVKLGDTDQEAAIKRVGFAAGQFSPIGITGPLGELYAGAPAPLVGASILSGIPMSHNTPPPGFSGAATPIPSAPTPLPTPTAPVTVPLQRPRTRIDLLRGAPTPTRTR